MPRIARNMMSAHCYHALNRGNDRTTLFRNAAEYDEFLELLDRASARHTVDLYAYCVMPNHFHFVVRADPPQLLAKWMHLLLTTHAHRFRLKGDGAGHVWQGRYKTFPVQVDAHFLSVVRYVERNPLTAGLVSRAEDWRWSSLHERLTQPLRRLAQSPVPMDFDWRRWVNAAVTQDELDTLRQSARRGTPFGDAEWTQRTARDLGLGSSLRKRGRPRKNAERPHF